MTAREKISQIAQRLEKHYDQNRHKENTCAIELKKLQSSCGKGTTMVLKYDALKEAQEELESLIGLGVYQAESETLRDYLRELQARYGEPGDLGELRRQLDLALGKRELSAVLRKMREEEMH